MTMGSNLGQRRRLRRLAVGNGGKVHEVLLELSLVPAAYMAAVSCRQNK